LCQLSETVQRDQDGNIVGRGSRLGRLKTDSSLRDIAIPQALLDVLHEWQEHCKLNGIKTDNEAYVFPNTERGKKNERRSYSGLRNMFQRFVVKHGLKDEGLTLWTMRSEKSAQNKIGHTLRGMADYYSL